MGRKEVALACDGVSPLRGGNGSGLSDLKDRKHLDILWHRLKSMSTRVSLGNNIALNLEYSVMRTVSVHVGSVR